MTEFDPPYRYDGYVSTRLRAPSREPIAVAPPPHTLPLDRIRVRDSDSDLTRRHEGAPLGERIIVAGRVLDPDGRGVEGAIVEIWQANAAGRYADRSDEHDAPLDPNFTGAGRCRTDSNGAYRFVTIKPGAYPWRNHDNAWRPAHIHFSVLTPSFADRLVTQMYFPGDPLLEHDPILLSIPDPRGRARLVASFDWPTTQPEWALGYRWDIVLRNPAA